MTSLIVGAPGARGQTRADTLKGTFPHGGPCARYHRSRVAVGRGDQHVDEERRLPAERVGQDTAEQYAEHEPGGPGTAPDRHRPVARSAFGTAFHLAELRRCG